MLTQEMTTSRLTFPNRPEGILYLVAACILLPLTFLALIGQLPLVLATMILGTLVLASLRGKTAAIVSTFLFLLVLGEIRRVVAFSIGPPGLDPLLLVGTMFATYLAIPLLLRVRLSDALSKAVFALMVIMCLEVLNPRQGPISVGLSGALFYLTPVFWFWIARHFGTERLFGMLINWIVIPAGVAAAILGICQTYIGFLPWESAWIKASLAAGYTALNLGGGHIRSFGFSSNGTEYGNLLMIAITCSVAAMMTGRRAYGLLLPLLLSAQLLASQRAPLIKVLLAVAVMWALRGVSRRAWVSKLILASLFGGGMVVYTLTQAGSGGGGADRGTAAQYATRHVTQGLSHPLDPRYSTAGVHFDLFKSGILSGIENPLGFGLGAVTLGSGKFGGGDPSVAGSSEVDISDSFIAMGVLGGLTYLLVILVGLKYAVEYTGKAPEAVGLPIIGMLTCMLGVWVPLGEYALGPLLWFCLGFLAKDLLYRRSLDLDRPL
jgi:hypothetical protein